MTKTKTILRLSVACVIAIGVTGCSSLSKNTLKAPCGPLAGMTDPCGDRTPINTADEMETIFSENLMAETI